MSEPVLPAILEPLPLNTYFAVQLKPGENTHEVAGLFMQASKKAPLFRRLEVLDVVSFGTCSYVRMRTDSSDPVPMLEGLLVGGRGVIHVAPGGGYSVRLPGRTGKIAGTVMHAVPKPGQTRLYRGTKIKFWERQFQL